MRHLNYLLFLVFITTTAFQCGDAENGTIEITKIVYEFGDSSVPPPYHRSYEITVTPDSVRLVIDSYGDILADKQFPITEQEFLSVINALETHNIKKCNKKEDNNGCSGWYV